MLLENLETGEILKKIRRLGSKNLVLNQKMFCLFNIGNIY